MLFNSFEFILGFVPCVAVAFFAIGRMNRAAAAVWLALASLFFYGWWDPRYVPLLVGSVLFNFAMGSWIARCRQAGSGATNRALAIAIAADLVLLGYFKYAHFFVATADDLVHAHWTIANIVLPLGISFFTFTQIAFLVDVSRGLVAEINFVHYLLFVTYFPHLIAGPILHHKEMMPQFALPQTYRVSAENLSVGLTMFSIGLFKKVVLADSLARTANGVFSAGMSASFIEAWSGALAYTLQIYFDFSGYSDMAIGVSRIFGIRLPLNFNSPYKALNIVDFWRRWHMTLSRFLRDYLYIPLGGNRLGAARRYVNLMITMLLGGLWHGAGWTFVIWGGIHGAYISVHHLLEARRKATPAAEQTNRLAGGLVTFMVVVVAWVFFRAPSLGVAGQVLAGMTGLHGLDLPPRYMHLVPAAGSWLAAHGVMENSRLMVSRTNALLIALALAIVWSLPNSQELLGAFDPAIGYRNEPGTGRHFAWAPSFGWVAVTAVMFGVALSMIGGHSEFLYFQF